MLNDKIDKAKLNTLQKVKRWLVILTCFLLGIGFSNLIHPNHVSQQTTKSSSSSKENSELSQQTVTNFLNAYYTKKDLGENRNRYKELMTDAAYKTAVTNENKAENQAYKGYVVDQVLDSSENFIDAKNKQVIVNVKYHNLSLTKKNDTSTGTSQSKTATLLITYVKQDGKYLVNDIKAKKLSDQTTSEPQQNESTIRSAGDTNGGESTSDKQGDSNVADAND